MGDIPKIILKIHAFKIDFRKEINNKSKKWKDVKALEDKINEEYGQAKFKFNYKVELSIE